MKRGLLVCGALAIGAWLVWPWLASASQLNRIRFLMGAVSLGVFLFTILAIRSYKLREKYAVLWLMTAVMITLVALFPQLVDVTREWFGMQYVTSVVAVIFVFLVLVSFHFSIALSALNDKAVAMASRCAILEARIQELEQRLGPGPAIRQSDSNEHPTATGR